jgi:hypothetical protein
MEKIILKVQLKKGIISSKEYDKACATLEQSWPKGQTMLQFSETHKEELNYGKSSVLC